MHQIDGHYTTWAKRRLPLWFQLGISLYAGAGGLIILENFIVSSVDS